MPEVTLVANRETSRAPVTRYEIQFVQRDASTQANDDVADRLGCLGSNLDDGAAILVPTPPTNRN